MKKHAYIKRHVQPVENQRNSESVNPETSERCFFLVASSSINTTPVTTLSNSNTTFSYPSSINWNYGDKKKLDDVYHMESENTKINNIENDYRHMNDISVKETSLSSGVASGASSDLSECIHESKRHVYSPRIQIQDYYFDSMSSASPLAGSNIEVLVTEHDFESNKTCCKCNERSYYVLSNSKSTQTDWISEQTRPPRKMRTSYDSMTTDTSRRDSGYSSMTSPRTPNSSLRDHSPLRLISEDESYTPVFSNNGLLIAKSNKLNPLRHSKELLLENIKKTLFSYHKEMLLIDLKDKLNKSSENTTKEWKPIHEVQPKGVLKQSVPSKDATEFLQLILNSRYDKFPFNTKTTVSVVREVRGCLDIINQSMEKPLYQNYLNTSFQQHRKIKLRSYAKQTKIPTKQIGVNIEANQTTLRDVHVKQRLDILRKKLDRRSPNKRDKENQEQNNTELEAHVSTLCNEARKGNLKEILNIMKYTGIDVSQTDHHDYPAFHYAIKNKHFRTAILLLESGTNVKDYTARRIQEYKQTLDLYNKNIKGIT